MENKVQLPKTVRILSSEAIEAIEAKKHGVTVRFFVESAILAFAKSKEGAFLMNEEKRAELIADEEEEAKEKPETDTSTPHQEESNTSAPDTPSDNEGDGGEDDTVYAFG